MPIMFIENLNLAVFFCNSNVSNIGNVCTIGNIAKLTVVMLKVKALIEISFHSINEHTSEQTFQVPEKLFISTLSVLIFSPFILYNPVLISHRNPDLYHMVFFPLLHVFFQHTNTSSYL